MRFLRWIHNVITTFRIRRTHDRVSFASMDEAQQKEYLRREAGEFVRRYGRVINALAKE